MHVARQAGERRSDVNQPRNAGDELQVISDFYDFMLALIRRTQQFPRSHRYSLGTAMEERLQRILALLLKAKYRRDRVPFLDEANIELETLRFQIRLAKDVRALPLKAHGALSRRMLGIGAQIGGWRRASGARA